MHLPLHHDQCPLYMYLHPFYLLQVLPSCWLCLHCHLVISCCIPTVPPIKNISSSVPSFTGPSVSCVCSPTLLITHPFCCAFYLIVVISLPILYCPISQHHLIFCFPLNSLLPLHSVLLIPLPHSPCRTSFPLVYLSSLHLHAAVLLFLEPCRLAGVLRLPS